MLVDAPKRGSRNLDQDTFFCMGCLDEHPSIHSDGRRNWLYAGAWLECRACRGKRVLGEMIRNGEKQLLVHTDALGTPVSVGDWGETFRFELTHCESHVTLKGNAAWRFRFLGPQNDAWIGKFYANERRGKKGYDTFAPCKSELLVASLKKHSRF